MNSKPPAPARRHQPLQDRLPAAGAETRGDPSDQSHRPADRLLRSSLAPPRPRGPTPSRAARTCCRRDGATPRIAQKHRGTVRDAHAADGDQRMHAVTMVLRLRAGPTGVKSRPLHRHVSTREPG